MQLLVYKNQPKSHGWVNGSIPCRIFQMVHAKIFLGSDEQSAANNNTQLLGQQY